MATEQEVKEFVVEVLPGLGENGGIVHFGIRDTPYNTQWDTNDSITFGVQMITASNIAKYRADLFNFMVQVYGLSADAAISMLNGAALYAGADAEKKAQMIADAARTLAETEDYSGIPAEEM